MNYLDVNKQTANALARQNTNSIFNNWEHSGRQISSLAIRAEDLSGDDESFLARSKILPALLKSVAQEDLSIMDLINLVQSAKAIETGDTKAATFVRDTSGGKPIEKREDIPASRLTDLTDEQLAYIEANAEVTQ